MAGYALRVGFRRDEAILNPGDPAVADVLYMISENSDEAAFDASVKAAYPSMDAIAPNGADYGKVGGNVGMVFNNADTGGHATRKPGKRGSKRSPSCAR